MDINLLQTEKWQKLQNDLKIKSHLVEEKNYAYLAIEKKTPTGEYLYIPYGPCFESKKGLEEALKSLISLAKSINAIFIRVEPKTAQNCQILSDKAIFEGYRIKKTKNINPADTWILDITKDKAEIIKNFSQGTRTRYNQFTKKGITVEISQNDKDIKHLIRLQKKLAKEKNISAFEEDYLKAELEQPFSTLYLVKYEGKVIAASLFFDYDNTRYYMQSAADLEYKKLPGTVALLSTAIFDAKEKGLKSFDFWGIAPENAPKNHPWAGFTEFKKSFGGQAVHYAGTYDIVIKPQKYALYKIARKINKLIRKIKN